MNVNRFLTVVLGTITLLTCHPETVSSDMDVKPVNVAALAGQKVTFSCSTKDRGGKVLWDYYKLKASKSDSIWNGRALIMRQGDPDIPLFGLNTTQCSTSNQCDLIIEKVMPKDAGWIACAEAGSNDWFVASLTILESETKCQLNTSTATQPVYVRENTALEVNCSVNYRGYWVPVIKCNQGSVIVNVTADNSKLHTILIVVDSNWHTKMIQCNTYFDERSRSASRISQHSISDSVPVAEYRWSSPTIRLENFTRIENFVSLGDKLVIECTAPKTSQIRWEFTPLNSAESQRSLAAIEEHKEWIERDIDIQSRKFSNKTISVLTHANIQLKHLGLYTCEVDSDSSRTTVEYKVSEFRGGAFIIDNGGNVSMNCRISPVSNSIWSFQPRYSDQFSPTIIADGSTKIKNGLIDTYNVQVIEIGGLSNSVLTLHNVQVQHVGVYRCNDKNDANNRYIMEHEVDILVSKPDCAVSLESTTEKLASLAIVCTVIYSGRWIPKIQCLQHGHHQQQQLQQPQQQQQQDLVIELLNNTKFHVINQTLTQSLPLTTDEYDDILTCVMDFIPVDGSISFGLKLSPSNSVTWSSTKYIRDYTPGGLSTSQTMLTVLVISTVLMVIVTIVMSAATTCCKTVTPCRNKNIDTPEANDNDDVSVYAVLRRRGLCCLGGWVRVNTPRDANAPASVPVSYASGAQLNTTHSPTQNALYAQVTPRHMRLASSSTTMQHRGGTEDTGTGIELNTAKSNELYSEVIPKHLRSAPSTTVQPSQGHNISESSRTKEAAKVDESSRVNKTALSTAVTPQCPRRAPSTDRLQQDTIIGDNGPDVVVEDPQDSAHYCVQLYAELT